MINQEHIDFHQEQELKTTLSSLEKEQILSVFPEGSKIQDARFFDNYNLPCPIKVRVKTPSSKEETVVLRKTRHGEARIEADVLKTLHNLDIPVPKVLSSPEEDCSNPKGQIPVLSLLSGINLQKLSMGSHEELQKSKKLLIEGIKKLQTITDKINKEPISKSLPHMQLIDQLQEARNPQKPWSSEPIFLEAVKKLEPILENITTPLVFTNGDYQPANFLTDKNKITGFVDFESACFQDPLIGIAKFPICDLHPINKAGFVDDFLKANEFTKADFAPRLALGCLMTLQKEIAIKGGSEDDKEYKKRVLGILEESLETIYHKN